MVTREFAKGRGVSHKPCPNFVRHMLALWSLLGLIGRVTSCEVNFK